ncbi:diacylglycerol/lipid kinase family protein [Microbacterium sp. KNMS]
MALERIAIVWNPSKTEREVLETGLAAALGDDEREISWWETTVEDPGQKATEDALEWGADVIVAAGGDGTVRAVAERLAEPGAGAELAIVPLGTGNLLARNLDIPLNNPQAAFARALADEARVIDIGWIETAVDGAPTRQAFAVMAGFGIDAHMIVETDDDLKSKVGWLAYVESLGRAVNASEVIELRIAVDGGEAVTAPGHTLMVGNCGMLQGGITLLPDADPSDGELDLLLLSAEGIAGWLDTLRSFVWDNGIRRLMGATDRAESGETAAHARATSVAVELPQPRVLEVDGDDLGEVTQFAVEIQPGALRVR